jgi:mono/diheme cytochrome c family protein
MRISKLFVLTLAAALAFSLTSTAFAADGAALFKAKCGICHGADGQGKVGPALKGTSLSADDIVEMLTKGNEAKKPPHKKPIAGLSAEEIKAVADHVKTLK